MSIDHDRWVPAPELGEVSRTWWDVDVDPVVTWDAAGRVFTLVDPYDPDQHRLGLLELAAPAEDPGHLASVLAEGLAACDFPPTDDGASPGRVRATLRAANVDVRPVGG